MATVLLSLSPPVEHRRRLPWSRPGDSRAGGVAGVRRFRVKGHDPSRRRRERGRGSPPSQAGGGRDEEGRRSQPRHLNLSMVRDALLLIDMCEQLILLASTLLSLSLCDGQVRRSNPSSRRSGSPTRLLLSDWWRAVSAPPPPLMMMMKMLM